MPTRTMIETLAARLRAQKELADCAILQVEDAPLHVALHPETNSIAIIMKHVGGGLVSRFTDFLSTDGEKPWRDRDREFVDEYRSRAEVLADWDRGWTCLYRCLDTLTDDDLPTQVTIRGAPHTVLDALLRALGHVSYHVGQIIMIARVHAGDRWQTLTIPRGGTRAFNDAMGYRP